MPTRMGKRVVLVQPNRPLEVWDRPIGEPGAGEVLLRVQLAGVCGTDVHLWRGELALPGLVGLGHEGIALVEELGSGVSTDYAGAPLHIGDRVYWCCGRPCNRRYECTVRNDPALCAELLQHLFRDAAEPPSTCYSELTLLPAVCHSIGSQGRPLLDRWFVVCPGHRTGRATLS